jgi:acyl-CoA reductase-like NAD-dependent aldehyde dehydrogenase
LLAGLDGRHPAVREEIFGPVVVLQTFGTAEEAVELANSGSYGLGAGVWTADAELAIQVAQEIAAGNVWVNGYGVVHPSVPFGGFKDSGVGRDLGPHHIDFYTEEKTIWLGLRGRSI